MDEKERKEFDREKKAHETIMMCLPKDMQRCFTKAETSYDLWTALSTRFGGHDPLQSSRSNEGINEMLVKKEDEVKALQSQVLIMETEHEEMRLKVVKLEERILELESQQTVLIRLQKDHDRVLKTVQGLREQLSHSTKQPVKGVKKKIYPVKSSKPCSKMVCAKKISQFTNYSLQKNKKYYEKSQSTKQRKHQKVDCCDNSGNSPRIKSSVSFQKPTRTFKPTQPQESRQTKSYVYTRAHMFAFAPPQFHHMVQRRRKDFVPLSPRKYSMALVPRNEFRHVSIFGGIQSL